MPCAISHRSAATSARRDAVSVSVAMPASAAAECTALTRSRRLVRSGPDAVAASTRASAVYSAGVNARGLPDTVRSGRSGGTCPTLTSRAVSAVTTSR